MKNREVEMSKDEGVANQSADRFYSMGLPEKIRSIEIENFLFRLIRRSSEG